MWEHVNGKKKAAIDGWISRQYVITEAKAHERGLKMSLYRWEINIIITENPGWVLKLLKK